MKVFTNNGTFSFLEGESPLIYLDIEVARPGNGQFLLVKAILDTGASTLVIPQALATRLGIEEKDITGTNKASTAGGEVIEPETLCDVRIRCQPSKQVVLLAGIRTTISTDSDEVLIGLNALRYFSVLFRRGGIALMEFHERSVNR